MRNQKLWNEKKEKEKNKKKVKEALSLGDAF